MPDDRSPTLAPATPAPPTPLTELDHEALGARLADLGEPAYRSRQILAWVYQRGILDYARMSDLGKELRAKLTDQLPLASGSRATALELAPDGTQKLSIELSDGNVIEAVVIREAGRVTFCLSTQVGCAARCRFCRSGLHGLLRNLSRAEIVEEALHLKARLHRDERLSNVVFMGIGEPLDNFDNLVGAIGTLTAPWGLGLSPRRITVSTVGRTARITRLAEAGFPVTLAVSLHAGTQATRDALVAGRPRTQIDELVAAARHYAETTGRNVTFEYVLVADHNDSPEEARALARLVAGSHIHVNLIPLNPNAQIDLATPTSERIDAFRDILASAHIPVTLRKRKGFEISAACGQLISADRLPMAPSPRA